MLSAAKCQLRSYVELYGALLCGYNIQTLSKPKNDVCNGYAETLLHAASPGDLPGISVMSRGRAEALDLFAVISVQLATLSEQLRPLARLYAARGLSMACGILFMRPTRCTVAERM